MITLATGGTLKGKAGTATAVTYTIYGDSIASATDAFQVLGQGQLPTVTPGDLLITTPVPASTVYLIKEIQFANTTASPVTGITLYVNGTAAANQVNGGFAVPANGSATLDGVGVLRIYGSDGILLSTIGGAAGGDLSGAYPNPTVTKINGTALSGLTTGLLKNTTGTGVPSIAAVGTDYAPATSGSAILKGNGIGGFTNTVAGTDYVVPARAINTTAPLTGGGALSADLTLALTTTPAGQTPVGSTRLITATAPITIAGTTSADLSADRTIAITAATTSAAGSLSALDKKKLDNMYIDVTATSLGTVTPAQTAAQNVTGINAILAAAPSGSTIFFPGGAYQFNAAWTWPSKFFIILGVGQNRAGGYTELQWTANVAGSLITLTDGFWYSRFTNITFSTTVDQTAGYSVQCGNNVGINFTNCSWQTAGGFFNSCIGYDTAGNGGNSCFVDTCIVGGFKGTGIRVSSGGTSVVISNTQVLGQWGGTGGTPASAQALAGISGGWVGALQINDCDVIGCQNNLLLNPVTAASEVCASVFCTNTYFDNSGGSCIKITGTGATVRCRFDTCSFTTAGTNFTTAGTNLSAVEISTSFAYGVGGQGIDFVNCNIFNTFGTTGTTNGYVITGGADFSIGNCRIAGWTNGVQVTPIAVAGRTQPTLSNNTIGPTGGIGANSVGVLLNAGAAAYGSMVIESNILEGNTSSPMTDNSAVAVGGQKVINSNPGLVAKGALQLCSSAGAAVINARGAATASTTETFLFATKIPGNGVSVGQTFRVSFFCIASAAATCIVQIRVGSTGTIASDTSVSTMLSSASLAINGWGWYDGLVTIAALGASNTMSGSGLFIGGSTIASTMKTAGAEIFTSANTANPLFIVVSMAASAGTITIKEGVIEAL